MPGLLILSAHGEAGLRVQQGFCVKPNSATSKNLQNLQKKKSVSCKEETDLTIA